MKKIFLTLITVFATASAFASPFSNFYVDAFGGCNIIENFHDADVSVDMDIGYIAGGALGYRFSRFFRVEGEGAYRCNDLNKVAVPQGALQLSGKLAHITAMGNAIIEAPIFVNIVTPYVGAGFGKCWQQGTITIEPLTTDEGVIVFDEKYRNEDESFAYQGIAGITFCNACLFKAGLEYRYLNGSKLQANHAIALNLRAGF